MIVGFSKHSQGRGAAPVNYLVNPTHKGEARIPPPVILRGQPGAVRRLIDSLDFEHVYTSGVLSFAPGETITPEMEQDIMDRFEAAFFAGLDADRYSILWVRHTHAGHHELHFLTPRVELVTGKSLNIAPPGSQRRALSDAFRSMINAEYGLADPDDPARSQAVSLPNHLAKLAKAAERAGQPRREDIREVITAGVMAQVVAGKINDRRRHRNLPPRGGVHPDAQRQGLSRRHRAVRRHSNPSERGNLLPGAFRRCTGILGPNKGHS